jgi:hypothetical protein
MNRKINLLHYLIYILFLMFLLVSCQSNVNKKSSKNVSFSEVKKDKDGFHLYRNGEKYYIKGAGGQNHLDLLAASGGNSFRLWSTDEHQKDSGKTIQQLLDKADSLGLTVTLGLWVTHPRHDKDFYSDSVLIKNQFDTFQTHVRKYKNHPALLMWAVGNEVHLHSADSRVWEAVGDIAEMIKKEDPNHPIATVTAGISAEIVNLIKTKAPAIEILGVNFYDQDLHYVPRVVKEAGWDKAYFMGEYGPIGPWKSKVTDWGAKYEPTGEQKINAYKNAYKTFIGDSIYCIGSYAFKWGWKWEKTYSWFNLFTKDGVPVTTLDALSDCWKGVDLKQNFSMAQNVLINDEVLMNSDTLKTSTEYKVEIPLANENISDFRFEWRIYPEGTSKARGGDYEDPELPLNNILIGPSNQTTLIRTPDTPGAYRLYAFVYDKRNHVSISNVPFYAN